MSYISWKERPQPDFRSLETYVYFLTMSKVFHKICVRLTLLLCALRGTCFATYCTYSHYLKRSEVYA